MKKVLRWIVIVWTVIALPYILFETPDLIELFFGLVYSAIILGLMVSDLREEKK